MKLSQEQGQNLIEYTLLVALICIVVISAAMLFGVQLGEAWETIGSTLLVYI